MRRKKLQVDIENNDGVVTVKLVGEANFDFDAADSYIEKILSHKPKSVVIDASELAFVSSVGMCFLLNLRKAMIAAGGSLKVAALQPLVQNALKNAHIHFLFETGEK